MEGGAVVWDDFRAGNCLSGLYSDLKSAEDSGVQMSCPGHRCRQCDVPNEETWSGTEVSCSHEEDVEEVQIGPPALNPIGLFKKGPWKG